MQDWAWVPTIRYLTHCVRCLSVRQVEKIEFAHANPNLTRTTRWLKRLGQRGLVQLQMLAAHPELELRGPLLDYHPGDPTPEFDSLAYRAQVRWQRPLVMTLIATATDSAKRLTGGTIGGRAIRLRELNHDLLLSSAFLSLHKHIPTLETYWRGEDAVYATNVHASGQKIPDAVITGPGPPVIVESAGAYGEKKLRAFHREFNNQRYQLW